LWLHEDGLKKKMKEWRRRWKFGLGEIYVNEMCGSYDKRVYLFFCSKWSERGENMIWNKKLQFSFFCLLPL